MLGQLPDDETAGNLKEIKRREERASVGGDTGWKIGEKRTRAWKWFLTSPGEDVKAKAEETQGRTLQKLFDTKQTKKNCAVK